MQRLFEKVTIIGPGLIGGSLGFALLERGVCEEVVGVGRRQCSIDEAVRLGAVTSATLDIEEGVAGADLVVLATSVGTIPTLAQRAIPHMKESALLTDVGSTKRLIVNEIEKLLADDSGIGFVGSHPLAGSEKRGVQAAREDLFDNSVCVLTPTARTKAETTEAVANLWTAVGARVVLLDPAQHDSILSRVSHLPHVVAAALLNLLADSDMPFAASGFRDTTRVASSDVNLWTEICAHNKQEILNALDALRAELDRISAALGRDDLNALRDYLNRAKERRDSLNRGR